MRDLLKGSLQFVLIAYFISFFGLATLNLFDVTKKRWIPIYEALMEEFEWRFKDSSNENNDFVLSRGKIILKQFILNGDLPFVTGNYGKTIYFILFIFLLILKIYITILM